MKRLLLFALLSLLLVDTISTGGETKVTKVAIIDTGLDLNDPRFKNKLCPNKHWDFVDNDAYPQDIHGHGTHVAGLISQYAEGAKFCLMIFKYYEEKASGAVNIQRMKQAMKIAVKLGADVVNISGGGPSYDIEEFDIIKTNPKVTFVVAAGNESKNIDTVEGAYFPASYSADNLIRVGSLEKCNFKLRSSNFGSKVTAWEIGLANSTLPGGRYGHMAGTSQATAIRTGKILSGKASSKCNPTF